MQQITLGAGDHTHIPVKAGEPVEVSFSVPTTKPGRGNYVWETSFQTFDAAGDAKVKIALDDGEAVERAANFGTIIFKGLAGGPHKLMVTCDQDDDSLGFDLKIGVVPQTAAAPAPLRL